MKKVLAMLLVMVLALTMLAGCGGDKKGDAGTTTTATKSDAGTTTTTTKSDASSDTTAAAEPVTVKVSYPCMVIVPSEDSVVAVEEAINNHLAEINSGVRMKLEAVDINNYTTAIDMKQIGGEELDLYMCLGGFSDQVNSNKLLPLTSEMDGKLKPVSDITGVEFFNAAKMNGEIYGVPVFRTDVVTYYWIVETSVAESLGFKEGDTIDMKGLDEQLAKLHDMYPDKIAMAVRPGMNGGASNFCLGAIYAGPDYYSVSGIVSGLAGASIGVIGDDLTVRDMYETDYFKDICQKAYEWNQKGYVNKDASVATEEGYDLMKADRALSYIIGYGGYDPQTTDAETDTTHGKSVLYIPIENTLNMPSGLIWGVSYGCKNVTAACEALSLFYTDPFVMNSILYGVEGRDYVDTGLGNGDDKVVMLPEGLDMFSVPYYAYFTCGIMGNEYLDWISVNSLDDEIKDRREEHKEFQNNAKKSPIYGFTLNTANIINEMAAISNIESQYLGGLLTGELNPDENIPKLVEALKGAGIDNVIAETQKQLDEWVSANK